LNPQGFHALAVIPSVRATGGVGLLVADCEQLRALLGQHSLKCPLGRFVLDAVDPYAPKVPLPQGALHAAGAASPKSTTVVTTSVSGRTASFRGSSRVLDVYMPMPFRPELRALVVPPTDPELLSLGSLQITGAIIAVPAGNNDADEALRASVASADPLAEVDFAGGGELAADAGYANYATTILLLALIVCVVGGIGVAITALDAVLNRRRQLQPLLVLGVPRSILGRITIIEITSALVAPVAIGLGIAGCCGALYVQHRTGAHLAGEAFWWTGLGGVATAFSVALIAVTLVPGTPNRISTTSD
jgi:hypothetical protein